MGTIAVPDKHDRDISRHAKFVAKARRFGKEKRRGPVLTQVIRAWVKPHKKDRQEEQRIQAVNVYTTRQTLHKRHQSPAIKNQVPASKNERRSNQLLPYAAKSWAQANMKSYVPDPAFVIPRQVLLGNVLRRQAC